MHIGGVNPGSAIPKGNGNSTLEGLLEVWGSEEAILTNSNMIKAIN
jgi:hypothetical protein